MKTARERIESVLDRNTFHEYWSDLYSYNFLGFPEYEDKLEKARVTTHEKENIITGIGAIKNCKCVMIFFEPNFLTGTMGVVAGEKIARAFKLAIKKKLPVISISASGGVRLQEGVIALMQMAKTTAMVSKHNEKGLLYISVISNPTLGGVTASFVSLADIIVGEKGALYGFTGKRIIEATTHEKIPHNFQTVEYAKNCGMIDLICNKENLRDILGQLLNLHK